MPKNRKSRPKISQFVDQNRQKGDPKEEKMEKKSLKNVKKCRQKIDFKQKDSSKRNIIYFFGIK